MKRSTRFFSYTICMVLIATMFTFAPGVFAEEKESAAEQTTENNLETVQQETVLESEPETPTEASSETDPPNTLKAVTPSSDRARAAAPVPEYWNITVSQTSGGTVSAASRVKKGSPITVTVTPKKGYGVAALYIDGKSVGSKYKHTFTPAKNTRISASFRKSDSYIFIMLDAGHYGNANRSPVLKSFYESKMTWQLHLYLKQELEKYRNVVVDTTRSSQGRDRDVYYRGAASKGYDLFLSLHSNATGSRKADYPLIITQRGKTNDALAISLGQTIQSIMGTKQTYQVWQRLNRDKKTEYYGVLRGSKAAGTKGMIVEHSFHTNLAATKWLSSNYNLKRMAVAEAADIAAYYGLSKSGRDVITPSRPSVSVSSSGYSALNIRWRKSIGATGYVIYRATKRNGKYYRIKTITRGTTLSFRNTKRKTGRTYYYKVRPYRKSGGYTKYGSYSSVKSGRAKPYTPSVSSKAGRRKVTVRWKKVSGANRYAVYRATRKNGKYKRIATLKSNRRSYTNTRLRKNKRYYYKVRAYRKIKSKNYYSNSSRYTTKRAK